jgi:arylsulfatase A-like enzyme
MHCGPRSRFDPDEVNRHSNRSFLAAAARAIALLLFLSGNELFAMGERANADRPPNILFILIDDLGWLDLGCYGSTFYETPHIDRLARQGMKFTNAYAACSVCSPTRASILTGQYPARLHLTDYFSGRPPQNAKLQIPAWTPYLTRETQTIATALKPANYVSALIGKWHLGGSRDWGAPPEAEDSLPERRGFDVNIAGSHYGQPPDYFFPYERKAANGITYRFPNYSGGREDDYLTDRLTDEAERFIEKNKDRPFFLYLAHYAVHTSIGNRFQAKPKSIAKYQAKADPKAPQHNAVYAAMIESMDESVGRLLHKLDELSIADRTVVVFTSDNGGYHQATAQPPLRGAKSDAYEGGIRVPLIVRWPHVIKAGSFSDTPVTSVDFFPTFCALAGVQPGPKHAIDGVSLLPVLKQTGKLGRDAIFWHYPHYNDRTTPHSIVRQGDFKLIEYFEDGRLELFNLNTDIGEKKNLASPQPEQARKMHQLLADWRKQVGAQLPIPKPAPK